MIIDYTKTFYLYKITNMLNGKIYVGQHTTDNPNDGYLTGGSLILQAIEHYGISYFKKEIIDEFFSAEALDRAERSIVDEVFVCSSNTYNLMLGGKGDSADFSDEYREELYQAGSRWFMPSKDLIRKKAADFEYQKNHKLKRIPNDVIVSMNTQAFDSPYLGLPESTEEFLIDSTLSNLMKNDSEKDKHIKKIKTSILDAKK